MHILHICSDFAQQKIYDQLITHLDTIGIEQTVYVPVRTLEEVGRYENKNLKATNYYYAHVLKPYHRILFHKKINTIYNNLINHQDISRVNITHAHFLFSDGAVALKLKRKNSIPYLVAVRNTDINVFYKYMPHLRPLAFEILKEAEKIIFITPSYRIQLLNKYIPKRSREEFQAKIHIIPNGIDSFWLDNLNTEKRHNANELRLLYVGDFSKNKNVPSLLYAVKALNKLGVPLMLTLVGGGGSGEQNIIKLLKGGTFSMVQYQGRIMDKERLLHIYRNHDIFIMASFKETFGVVYLEALSQGLPIIYTKGQGIDGYFEEGKIGYSVDPSNITMISQKITEAVSNIESLRANAVKEISNFRWANIAQHYVDLYYSSRSD